MKATVAYESSAEARRKLKAVKPLRWHRESNGSYRAKGVRGAYVLFHRSPNRRKEIFPWVVSLGGMRGAEIKGGGFDLKTDAQTFAAQYDAGLCGAPAVVVQAPSSDGLPPGVYRGTAAERKGARESDYAWQVVEALGAMGASREIAEGSREYIAQMEAAHIEPSVTAAVLVATKDHRHVHDCPDKHVELSEGGAAEARRGKRESHIFRGQRFDLFQSDGSWWFETSSGTGRGGFLSKDAAWAGAQQALGMPSGFSMAVEGGGAAAEARRKKRGLAPDDWMIPSLQQRLDQGQPGLGAYPTVNWAPFHIYYTHSDGKPTDKYQTGPDARGALRNFRLEGHKERVTKIVAVTLTSDGPKDVNHPDFVYNISDADTLEETGAAESKRRMPQPDPSKRGVPPIFQTLQQRLDAGGYPTVNWPPFHLYYLDRPHGMVVTKYQSGPDAQGALNNFRLEGNKNVVVKITDVRQTDAGPRDGSAIYFVDQNDQVYPQPWVDESGAAESKRRMPQPDPSSGLYVTRSSLTRSYFLMRGKSLLGEFSTRDEAMKEAERLGKE